MLPMQLSFRKLLGERYASTESIPSSPLPPPVVKHQG
jgi:hypothetical protein